jgi:hypothetical protein
MNNEPLSEAESRRYGEYARERLEATLSGLKDDASDAEVLGEVELALMALCRYYGSIGEIRLSPLDVTEYLDRSEPLCICPPGLVARGGFRSGCPAHHLPLL